MSPKDPRTASRCCGAFGLCVPGAGGIYELRVSCSKGHGGSGVQRSQARKHPAVVFLENLGNWFDYIVAFSLHKGPSGLYTVSGGESLSVSFLDLLPYQVDRFDSRPPLSSMLAGRQEGQARASIMGS